MKIVISTTSPTKYGSLAYAALVKPIAHHTGETNVNVEPMRSCNKSKELGEYRHLKDHTEVLLNRIVKVEKSTKHGGQKPNAGFERWILLCSKVYLLKTVKYI